MYVKQSPTVSAGCHINDVMNRMEANCGHSVVSAGCHINNAMDSLAVS